MSEPHMTHEPAKRIEFTYMKTLLLRLPRSAAAETQKWMPAV
jgi:hypothetical protein